MCSGIRPEDLEGAPSFETVRDKVESLLAGKLLVGHALHHDLEVETSTHNICRKFVGYGTTWGTFKNIFASVMDPDPHGFALILVCRIRPGGQK
jgi:DNA polymerase III epsilon subunit-like protein